MMRVSRRIVELADRVDHDFPDQAVLLEQIEAVVHGRFRYLAARVFELIDDVLG
jgi:hypothetical protein